jgi:hypothetical protein
MAGSSTPEAMTTAPPGLQYASDYTFVQADEDPPLETVFVRPMGNTIDVRVVNSDGSLVGDGSGRKQTREAR